MVAVWCSKINGLGNRKRPHNSSMPHISRDVYCASTFRAKIATVMCDAIGQKEKQHFGFYDPFLTYLCREKSYPTCLDPSHSVVLLKLPITEVLEFKHTCPYWNSLTELKIGASLTIKFHFCFDSSFFSVVNRISFHLTVLYHLKSEKNIFL